MNIILGGKVRDTVTGYTGIAVSYIKYLNGCEQIGIAAPVGKDGKIPDTQYFDHQRLEMIGEGVVARMSKTGGPQRDCPK